MNVIEIPGSRPNTLNFHVGDGFYYTINRENGSSVWLKCSIGSCYGTAVVENGDTLLHLQRHNHPPQPHRHDLQAVRSVILNRATSIRYVSFVNIVREERRRILLRELRAQLTYRRLRSAMQRRRSSIFPPLPASLIELTGVLLNPRYEHLTKTLDEEGSIYCCSVQADDGTHNIIFASPRCLEIMKEVPIIFLDGTFKISPSINGCYQVFTIVTIISHTVIPLVWCLMESKTESAYAAILLQIRARIMPYNFRLAVSDYEDAIINAVEAVFGVEVQGCYFHYVKDLGSWARTNLSSPVIALFPPVLETIRKTCALPLLPQNLLQRGMSIIRTEAFNHGPIVYNIVYPFLLYVHRYWILHVNRGRTLSVSGSFHRTNNASESNNHRMGVLMGVPHPNIYHFIRNITEFEDATVDDVESLRLGFVPNRHQAPAVINNDEYIVNLTAYLERNEEDADISYFLRAAAYTVENVIVDALGIEVPL